MESTFGICHHDRADCVVDGSCPFHSPSLHAMVEEPMVLRTDWGAPLIERLCVHGVGHPDPDSVAYLNRVTGQSSWGRHGCDGCCTKLGRPS